ncbi:hypothetical protein LJY25_07620 [Hymenobacter sp. BT175]|nr:hypothetical protein [Hymenobacter translucens]
MMTPANPDEQPKVPQNPSPDHTLEELAGLTGLLNPDLIWLEAQALDNADEPAGNTGATPTPGTI